MSTTNIVTSIISVIYPRQTLQRDIQQTFIIYFLTSEPDTRHKYVQVNRVVKIWVYSLEMIHH